MRTGFISTTTQRAHPCGKSFLPSRRPAVVVSNTQLTDAVYSLVLRDPHLADDAVAGQFANLYTKEASRIMPRPLGIASVGDGTAEFIFAVVGEGTAQFAAARPGDTIDVLGPLGKGYDFTRSGRYLLVGGGLGVPPLTMAAQELQGRSDASATALFGYRSAHFADASVARFTDDVVSIDESEGNVITLLDRWEEENGADLSDVTILSCGPNPMMKAVGAWATKRGIEAQLSLEERMGCGYGACVVCVTPTIEGLKKVCLDGPVFTATELGW